MIFAWHTRCSKVLAMSPLLKRAAVSGGLWLLAPTLAACDGSVFGPAAVGAASGPQPTLPSGQRPATPEPTDEQMQSADPGLHALAVKYFPGDETQLAPKRLARLTRAQLDATTQSLLPSAYAASVSTAMAKDPLQTNYEYAANLSFNDANFTPYLGWVSAIAARVRASPAAVTSCGAGDATCLNAAAKQLTARAFRGTVDDTRLSTYGQLLSAGASSYGVGEATGDLVEVTLSSPSYVFRDEVQTDASGLLLPAQRLAHLTYALADAPPLALALAEQAPLSLVGTPEAFAATAEQVLGTTQAKQKLLRFFLAWLEVRAPDELTLSPTTYPEFTGAVVSAAEDEVARFLQYQLGKPAPTLKDITQATQSFVSSALAPIYGLAGSLPPTGTPVALDSTQRLGIFSQPIVLASHSGPTTTRLVKRGVFFTRKVMCLDLGNPPQGVDTSLSTATGTTERERIESGTTSATCQGCHALINPFGFMQENYDATGKWRTTDNGAPVNARIAVDFLDEGHFEATTPVDALKGLTSSARFKQCFVRQLFRYYMGRDELPSDAPLLRAMFFQFADQDRQELLPLLKMLSTSSRFSHRQELP